MKKFYSLLALALMTVTSVFAEGWVAPTKNAVSVTPVADGTTEYYLYNVEAGGFLVAGNNWGTHACVAKEDSIPVGFRVRFHEVTDAAYEGYVSIEDYCVPKGGWKYMFFDGVDPNSGTAQNSFMDMGSQSPASKKYWKLTPVEGGYEISNAFLADEVNASNSESVNKYGLDLENLAPTPAGGSGSGTSTGAYSLTLDATSATVWVVISSDQINEWSAYLDVKALIEKYVEEGFTAASAYLDKIPAQTGTAEGVEAINALKAELEAAHVEYLATIATPENPVDMSEKILNRSFDNITYENWSGSGFGKGGTVGPCAERYEMKYDTWQKIEGLPNGVYKVSVDGFFRNGSSQQALDTKGQPLEAYIYGTNGTDTLKAPIMGMFDGVEPNNPLGVDGETSAVADDMTYYVPNTMKSACDYFAAGYYKGNSVVFAVTDGTAIIGVKKDILKTYDWTLLDNFGLTYYGDGPAAYQAWVDDIAANAGLKDYNERKVSDEYLEAWVEALEEAEGAEVTSSEDVVAIKSKLDAAEKALLENEAAWAQLIKVAQEGKVTDGKGLEGDEALALNDYLMEFEDEICYIDGDQIEIQEKGALLSTEGVIAETAKLRKLIDEATENGLQAGTDVTEKIVNASFAKGFDGWTKANGSAPEGNVGGLAICKNVERYEGVVDVQQVVTGLPKGVYELSCQAFERPSGNGSFDGSEEAKVFLFMNNVKTPVQNIVKDAIPESDAIDLTNCYITEETGAWPYDYNIGNAWIPNSVDGASYAFNAGRYKQSAKGLVTDGKMTIGLTSNGQKAHWVLWANFTLKYLGMDVETIKPMLDDAIAAIDVESTYGADVKAKAQALVEEAKALEDGGKMLTMIDELTLYADTINASKAIFAELAEAYAELEDNVAEYGDYVDEALNSAIEDCLLAKDGVYTDAEAQQTIADIAEYVRKLVAAAAKGEFDPEWAAALAQATAESPVELGGLDILVNPSFELGNLDGWNVASGTGDTGAKANSNATYTVTNADGDFVFNTWSGSAVDGGFFVSQDFMYLPTGTYQLKALLASDAGNTISLAANDNAKEYVMQNDKTIAEQGFVTFFMQEGPLTIKATSPTWFKADAFELLYFGEEDVTSQITDIFTAISDVNKAPVAAPAGIFAINGAKIATLKKGINIVRMADGKVRKVLVK